MLMRGMGDRTFSRSKTMCGVFEASRARNQHLRQPAFGSLAGEIPSARPIPFANTNPSILVRSMLLMTMLG